MISAKNAEILTAVLKMLSIGITANDDKKSYSLLRWIYSQSVYKNKTHRFVADGFYFAFMVT